MFFPIDVCPLSTYYVSYSLRPVRSHFITPLGHFTWLPVQPRPAAPAANITNRLVSLCMHRPSIQLPSRGGTAPPSSPADRERRPCEPAHRQLSPLLRSPLSIPPICPPLQPVRPARYRRVRAAVIPDPLTPTQPLTSARSAQFNRT